MYKAGSCLVREHLNYMNDTAAARNNPLHRGIYCHAVVGGGGFSPFLRRTIKTP
jgi:hypothetical protein